jgi:hypothetical protein
MDKQLERFFLDVTHLLTFIVAEYTKDPNTIPASFFDDMQAQGGTTIKPLELATIMTKHCLPGHIQDTIRNARLYYFLLPATIVSYMEYTRTMYINNKMTKRSTEERRAKLTASMHINYLTGLHIYRTKLCILVDMMDVSDEFRETIRERNTVQKTINLIDFIIRFTCVQKID